MDFSFAISMSPSAKHPFMSFAHFIVGLFVTFLLSIYIYIQHWFFVRYMTCIFSLVCSFSFHPLNRVFQRANIFHFVQIPFVNISFVYHVFGIELLGYDQPFILKIFSYIFFSKTCIDLNFIFKFMIHFERNFLSSVRLLFLCMFFFPLEYSIVPTLFLEKDIHPALNCFCNLSEINWTYLYGSINLCSIYLCVIPLIPHCLQYYSCIVTQYRIQSD